MRTMFYMLFTIEAYRHVRIRYIYFFFLSALELSACT